MHNSDNSNSNHSKNTKTDCKRQHKRHSCCQEIECTLKNNRRCNGLIWDISIGGAFVFLSHNSLNAGDEITIRLSTVDRCSTKAKVVRTGHDGYAVRFGTEKHELEVLKAVLDAVVHC